MMHGPTTIRFLISNALSLLGNSIAAVALPLILLATTGDALAAGTLALICAVPQMIIGVLGGAALDRFNRRNISILSDLMSAASVALIPIVDMVWGLNFWWFVALGLLGAVGDIPGMTARDVLLPAVTKRDGVNLQQFIGLSQSLDSLTTIIGPALAALFIGAVGGVPSLWFTAALSALAALVTATLPRSIGVPEQHAARNASTTAPGTEPPHQSGGVVGTALSALRDGLHLLFRSDRIVTCSTLFSFGIIMVMGAFQGLVLPVHFTQIQQPELLGYVLSALSGGMLISSLAYAALALHLRRRTLYVGSLAGMLVGATIMGFLPSFPLLLVGGFIFGLSAGPASALLGFFMLDRIPEASRGSAFGTQNSLLLMVAPVAVFATSVVVSVASEQTAALGLALVWAMVTIAALVAQPMRNLDDEATPATPLNAGAAGTASAAPEEPMPATTSSR